MMNKDSTMKSGIKGSTGGTNKKVTLPTTTSQKSTVVNKPTQSSVPTKEELRDDLVWVLQHRRKAKTQGEENFRRNLRARLQHISGKEPTTDTYGNIYLEMSDLPVLWVAHVDTRHDSAIDKTALQQQVYGFYGKDRDVFLGLPVDTDSGCLGADDGVGISCLLHLIENKVGGTYIFTRDEECGCGGAKAVTPEFLSKFKIAIEIDRRGTDEIINEMGVGVTASELFTKALCDQLGMGHKPSDKGSSTDVGHFAKTIPECVNVAAGYYSEHTPKEVVNLTYVRKLREALVKVDLQALLKLISDPVDESNKDALKPRKAGDFTTGSKKVSYFYPTNTRTYSGGYDMYGNYTGTGNYDAFGRWVGKATKSYATPNKVDKAYETLVLELEETLAWGSEIELEVLRDLILDHVPLSQLAKLLCTAK